MTYHVTAHAVAEARIVRNDSDRERLLAQLQMVAGELGWTCLAVCLMDTHYHLLVTTPEPNLARGMQYVNGCYAQFFNRMYGRRGHLFGGRYYGGKVVTQAHLLMTLRYIARNCLDKGADPARYSWSSYPGIIGTRPCWPFIAKTQVLELFGIAETGVELLRAFVEDDRPRGAAAGVAGSDPGRSGPV